MPTGTPSSSISRRPVRDYQQTGDLARSVGTKKKELVGGEGNAGREWQLEGRPEVVRVYDTIDPALGKVAPYRVCDLTTNTGWAGVGTDHDRPNSPWKASGGGGGSSRD